MSVSTKRGWEESRQSFRMNFLEHDLVMVWIETEHQPTLMVNGGVGVNVTSVAAVAVVVIVAIYAVVVEAGVVTLSFFVVDPPEILL